MTWPTVSECKNCTLWRMQRLCYMDFFFFGVFFIELSCLTRWRIPSGPACKISPSPLTTQEITPNPARSIQNHCVLKNLCAGDAAQPSWIFELDLKELGIIYFSINKLAEFYTINRIARSTSNQTFNQPVSPQSSSSLTSHTLINGDKHRSELTWDVKSHVPIY